MLEAEDCWDIVNGTELEPNEIGEVEDLDKFQDNNAEVQKGLTEIKDFRRRSKKAASLITQTINDSIVMSLDVHERNHEFMWLQLAEDYNAITPTQQSVARKEFLNFVTEEEAFLKVKQRYNELLRKVTVQGGVVDAGDRLETLLNALPMKYDVLRESYFAQTLALGLEYIWDRMFDIETTQKRRAIQSGAPGMVVEIYYQLKGRVSFRGRGTGYPGNRGAGRGGENCFRCGEACEIYAAT